MKHTWPKFWCTHRKGVFTNKKTKTDDRQQMVASYQIVTRLSPYSQVITRLSPDGLRYQIVTNCHHIVLRLSQVPDCLQLLW